MEYPKTFRNDDGVEITALNEIQAYVLEREGFKPVAAEKPARKGKQN